MSSRTSRILLVSLFSAAVACFLHIPSQLKAKDDPQEEVKKRQQAELERVEAELNKVYEAAKAASVKDPDKAIALLQVLRDKITANADIPQTNRDTMLRKIKIAIDAYTARAADLTPARAPDDATQKETKKLESTWQVVSTEFDGKVTEEENAKLIIKGNEFTCMSGDEVVHEGTFKIIEVKGKSRKTDLTFTKGQLKNEMMYNIAEWIDDDTFRTCVGGKERPAEFTSKGSFIIVFKRVKK